MKETYADSTPFETHFCAAQEQFNTLIETFMSNETLSQTHDKTEAWLFAQGNERLRRLSQGYFDLHAENEVAQ